MRKICFAVLLLPALAWAQPKTADAWFKEGENQWVLGNFNKAIEAFKQAFSLETNDSKKPAYLFNVAQSYRQINDCKNALFFYRRFLSLEDAELAKPLAPRKRQEIEDRIKLVKDRIPELEACVEQQTAIGKKPPTNTVRPDSDGGDQSARPRGDTGHKEPPGQVAATTEDGPGDGDHEDRITTPPPAGPHLISVRFTGGGTKVNAGDKPEEQVPVQATFALMAGYPIAINDKLTVEAGAAVTFTPVPFELGSGMGTRTGQLWGLVANGAATYEVIPKLGVRGDVGLGALFFANIDESSFIGGGMTTGALSMFHVRGAVSADYAITPNVVVTATPIAFTYSPPHDGLVSDIKSITSIDFMLGIGYRM